MMPGSPPLLRVRGLAGDYEGRPVFRGLDFDLAPGQSLALAGPSGGGKSTLLHILAGLKAPGAGLAEWRPGTRQALVMQNGGLFPWKTARENLELPLVLAGEKPGERSRRAASLMAELGLKGLGRRYPAQLSGGQRQRLALGRALAGRPDVLLLDEPFSSLDALTREKLQDLLAELWQERGLTFILTTHSIEEAVLLGRTIVVLGGDAENRAGAGRPPSTVTARFDNPGAGRPGFRLEEDFFALAKAVRLSLPAAAPGARRDVLFGENP